MDRAIVFGTISWGFESLRARIFFRCWVSALKAHLTISEWHLTKRVYGNRVKSAGAPLAQLAEHLTLNQTVEGSIPSRRIFSVIKRVWAGAGIGRQDRLRIYWGYAS